MRRFKSPLAVRVVPAFVVVVAAVIGAAPLRAEPAPADFIADARLYYRVVACQGSDPLPATLDAPTIDAHCAEMARRYARLAERYVAPAQAFFAQVRPAGLPTTVVYPFGGGDLLGALVTFPDAREITTISLEHAGDPTRLAKLTTKVKLAAALRAYRDAVSGLLSLHDSTSENMRKLERGGIPGQLSFHLTGMAAMGFEPVALRYWRFAPDGAVSYLDQATIDQLAATVARKKKGGWVDTDFSEAFTNMELTFAKRGEPAVRIVHRHVAANLADAAFLGSPLDKHLRAKGKVAAMTKAASYLLHAYGFAGIRDYLLENIAWMASDSTGLDPRSAARAGFEQVTYGVYHGPFLEKANAAVGEQMVALWGKGKAKKLPFRYGYPDNDLHVHLMITRPKQVAAP